MTKNQRNPDRGATFAQLCMPVILDSRSYSGSIILVRERNAIKSLLDIFGRSSFIKVLKKMTYFPDALDTATISVTFPDTDFGTQLKTISNKLQKRISKVSLCVHISSVVYFREGT